MTVPIRFGEVCLECLHLATSSVWGHCPSCGCPNHDSSFWTEDFPSVPSRSKQRRRSLSSVLGSVPVPWRRMSGRRETLSGSRPTPSQRSPLQGRLSESSQVTLWAIGLLCVAFIAVALTW